MKNCFSKKSFPVVLMLINFVNNVSDLRFKPSSEQSLNENITEIKNLDTGPSTEDVRVVPEEHEETASISDQIGALVVASTSDSIKDPAEKDVRKNREFSIFPIINLNRITRHSRSHSFQIADTRSSKGPILITAGELPLPSEEKAASPTGSMYSSKRVLRTSSINDRYKRLYSTMDGSWPEAKRMKKRNQLNWYCTNILINAKQVFWVVIDADIMEGNLKLSDEDPLIKADIVYFSISKTEKMYITKGLSIDSVFTLDVQDLSSVIFTLEVPAHAPIPIHHEQNSYITGL